MHFLKIFFRFLATGVIAALIIILIGRELWLFMGAQQVARHAQRLPQTARWQQYYGNCQAGLALEGELPFRGIQVRFLSEREYAVEIDCVGQQPFEVLREHLPLRVTKTTGSAGFFYDAVSQTLSGEVTLTFLGRSRVVYVDGLDVSQQSGVSEVRSDLPVSMCVAHGLTCCDPVEWQGAGLPMEGGVIDCPGNCYDSCLRRPVLLSFQANPDFSTERVVTLSGQDQLVTFAYTFDLQESEIQAVTIEYGDGTSESSTASRGQFSKAYRCAASSCTFDVRLSAVDTRGVVSAPTRLSSLRVVLNP